jgi:hypothetical protein
MGEVIQFVSRSERERARLIRQARAIYDSIFPPAHRLVEPAGKAAVGRAVSDTHAHRDEVLSS